MIALLLSLSLAQAPCCRITSYEVAWHEAKRDGRDLVCWNNCDPPTDLSLLGNCCFASFRSSAYGKGKPSVTISYHRDGQLYRVQDYQGDWAPGTVQQIKGLLDEAHRPKAPAPDPFQAQGWLAAPVMSGGRSC